MARSFGLIIYRALSALRRPFVYRQIAQRYPEIAVRLPERLGHSSVTRPEGFLIWLHASTTGKEAAICGLVKRLGAEDPSLSFLMTTEKPITYSDKLPPRLIHQYAPLDAGGPITAFLNHWHPDMLLWVGTKLRPALILETAQRDCSMSLIDAAMAPVGLRGWQRLASHALRAFRIILSTDPQASQSVRDAGATPESVEVVGPLQEEAASLPYNQAERNAIGANLKARPIWLATCVQENEEDSVIAAHKIAARSTHRLLLILSPDTIERAPALVEKLTEQGFVVASRAVEGEPDNETDIFVTDGEEDLGLWYRLASISFMGGTLSDDHVSGRSPLEPAALGSAIIHGPNTGENAVNYARFAEAGAARVVTSDTEFGATVSELLSPDKAATLAHAAWRVSTGGAEMNERISELVLQALEEKEGG